MVPWCRFPVANSYLSERRYCMGLPQCLADGNGSLKTQLLWLYFDSYGVAGLMLSQAWRISASMLGSWPGSIHVVMPLPCTHMYEGRHQRAS